MNADQLDEIAFGNPRTGASRAAWATIALLSAALVIAILVAGHYHGQVAALRRQTSNASRRAGSPVPSPSSWLTVSTTSVALVPAGSATGEVTFIAASPPTGLLTDVAVIAHLSGGRPHTRYTLAGGSCSGTSRHQWAAGVTDARGDAVLAGSVQRVAADANYWLELSPPAIGEFHPALAGDFAAATDITATYGPPMCGS